MRPAVKEQVESLGATFVDLDVGGEEAEGGYARELSAEEQRAQQEALAERMPDYDVVITTALVPGPAGAAADHRRERCAAMRPGSVIVDLAAETGGNCELTEPGEEVVDATASRSSARSTCRRTMPYHASQLYARNVSALLLAPGARGRARRSTSTDEITAGACVDEARQEVARA